MINNVNTAHKSVNNPMVFNRCLVGSSKLTIHGILNQRVINNTQNTKINFIIYSTKIQQKLMILFFSMETI